MMIDYKEIDAFFTPIVQDENPEKWGELRTTGIGGSDAGAIMGLNKYASPLIVYMQKKGVDGFKGNKATEWGHILEDPIRQKAAKELDVEIITVPGMYKSKEHEFMNANIDGLMLIPDGKKLCLNGMEATGLVGHEIKTSSRGEGFTEDEIPDSYFCQVQHYMAVTKLDYFVLTVFFLNSKSGRHYLIKRNDEFINSLINAETDFWENYVLTNTAPAPIGLDSENEYLKNLPVNAVIQLDSESEKLICEEIEIDTKIKDLTQKQKELKNAILLKLSELSDDAEDAERTTATVGVYKVTYNRQVRKSLDTDALKKAGIYAAYAKETSCKVLRISEVKA